MQTENRVLPDTNSDSAPEPATPPETVLSFRGLIIALAFFGAALGVIGVGLTLYLKSPNPGPALPGLDMIRHLTHPSGEATLYSWFSVLLLATMALGFILIAMVHWQVRALRWRYFVLAGTGVLLSADEAALLHEKMSGLTSVMGLGWSWTYSWLITAVPLAAVAGLFLLWVAKEIDSLLRKRLLVAGIVFLLGAVGMEVLGGLLETGTVGLGDQAQFTTLHVSILIEESLEVAGVIIALWAVLSHLRFAVSANGLRIAVQAERG
jgi:hypothetical protein